MACGLRWSGAKKTREPQHSSDNIVHRPLPPWLLDNPEFQRVADDCLDLWFANRDSGLAGLSSFVGTMYACATTFLSTHVIIATTARQRLELALTAMRLLERPPIYERRLSRVSVPPHVLERLAERCRVQADAVLVETPARPDILSDPAEGFRGHRQHESTLQSLKRLKQGMPLAVTELWDPHHGHFVDDTTTMATLIQDAAQDRQGRVTSSPVHGQNLLDQWYANFSQCRVMVERHEIANIILDSPNGKKPFPDGLPAAFLKRYCHQLAIIFHEAWIELASRCAPIDHVRLCLGFKKLIVVSKMEGANTIDKVRDLELGNEVRKVLARMLFKVLDEVCQHESHGLCHAQQAFVKGRDIIRNTTMLCRNFWAAHEEAAEVMILTCFSPRLQQKLQSHGLQLAPTMSSCGIEKAQEIVAIVESLLINMPVLILDGVEFAHLQLASGLTQGCPASCMLYIIGVDPLLSSLQQSPHISGVSGFVDDWSMGCHGLPAISAVSNLIHDFEQASGQQINRGKSAIITARPLSDHERASCLAICNGDICILARERVLCAFIGIHVSIHDQYYNAVHNWDMALSVYGHVRLSLSLAMGMLAVNMFMFTLFSYRNRQFFMPRVLLQEIERKVLRLLTPITWAKLGMFSAVGALYGTQLFLQGSKTFQCCQCAIHSRSLE